MKCSVLQSVIDVLRSDFKDCVTPNLLNTPYFNDFLHRCCALAWSLAATNPPLYVSSADTHFNPRFHESGSDVMNRSNLSENEDRRIGVFVWPTLYVRKRGQVLNKGIVTLE